MPDEDERPTRPKMFERCPKCEGLGRIVEPAGPGRYRPVECPECRGLQVVTIERYREIMERR
jgi:DnaJ-class molecular chaperone